MSIYTQPSVLEEPTDGFLTHNWAEDQLGRPNHRRVAKMNAALKDLGLRTWFDEEKMQGQIIDNMASGIDNTSVVVCFITQKYIEKVGSGDPHDNCRREFNYAEEHKTTTMMIPVVMEPQLTGGKWTGAVGVAFVNRLWIDFTDDSKTDEAASKIFNEIRRMQSIKSGSSASSSPRSAAISTGAASHVSAAVDAEDEERIEELANFMSLCDVTRKNVKTYSTALVLKYGVSSVKKLKKNFEKRGFTVLTDVYGIAEEDAEEIGEALEKMGGAVHAVGKSTEEEAELRRLRAGAHLKDDKGFTPLHHAAKAGNTALVESLILAGADVGSITNATDTPLIWAGANGHVNVVNKLLAAGALVDTKGKGGMTPFVCAATNGRVESMRALLEGGASLESKTDTGMTPLMCACSNGHIAAVQFLLNANVLLDTKNNDGNTALISNSAGGKIDVVRMLLDAGASVNLRSNADKTALKWAKDKSHADIEALLLSRGATL